MRVTSDLRGQDIIDSRDIISRIEYLEDLKEDALEAAKETREKIEETSSEEEREDLRLSLWGGSDGLEYGDTPDWTEEEVDELRDLHSLSEEASSYTPDWTDGETLIRESHFTDYARDLAEDIGAVDRNQPWPYNHIDWEAAAEELKNDYSEVTFGGETYLIRNC